MPAPSSTWTTQDTANWVAGSLVRETLFKQALLQNPQYLYDQLNAVVNNNFWANFEQQLQQGVALGAPIG